MVEGESIYSPSIFLLIPDKADFDQFPEKYNTTELYVGKVLVIGELIP
jgi:HSP90 family molecular chaperone